MIILVRRGLDWSWRKYALILPLVAVASQSHSRETYSEVATSTSTLGNGTADSIGDALLASDAGHRLLDVELDRRHCCMLLYNGCTTEERVVVEPSGWVAPNKNTRDTSARDRRPAPGLSMSRLDRGSTCSRGADAHQHLPPVISPLTAYRPDCHLLARQSPSNLSRLTSFVVLCEPVDLSYTDGDQLQTRSSTASCRSTRPTVPGIDPITRAGESFYISTVLLSLNSPQVAIDRAATVLERYAR